MSNFDSIKLITANGEPQQAALHPSLSPHAGRGSETHRVPLQIPGYGHALPLPVLSRGEGGVRVWPYVQISETPHSRIQYRIRKETMRPTASMASLAPASAAAAETFDARAGEALLDAEHALLAAVPERRRLNLARGRACARKALQKLGVGAVPILRGSDGEPLWPPAI